MKITILCIGNLKPSPEQELLKKYMKRLQWRVEIIEIPIRKGLSGDRLKLHEAQVILSLLPSGIPFLILDERGKSPSSAEFANMIANFQIRGQSHLVFCIGGSDGLDESIRLKAQNLICFGRMTWPHMLVRILLVEQLYRAQQILLGHPYHRS